MVVTELHFTLITANKTVTFIQKSGLATAPMVYSLFAPFKNIYLSLYSAKLSISLDIRGVEKAPI